LGGASDVESTNPEFVSLRIPKQEEGTVTGIYVLLGGLGLFTLGVLIFDLVTRPPGRRNAHK
jgi:hypothetical protein